MKPAWRWFRAALGTTALWLGGCAGYQLGDPVDVPFQTIYVPPPVNASLAPQATALLGTAIRHELDRSGRVRLGGPDAEATLTITLTDLRREISAEQEADTALARKWRVTLFAECALVDRSSGRAYFERRTVSAFDEVYTDSGLVAAEYQNMPVLTNRLAAAIAREVLSVW